MRKISDIKWLFSVSIGGTTGLFVGASLLSFVEIIYYMTIRPYSSYIYEKRRQLRLQQLKREKN